MLICEKNVANYALLQCKTFILKIWLCKFFDKYHVCIYIPLGVERNMKQRDPVNSRTSWNVFATLLCIRFNWSFFAINSLNESLSSCIRKKNSLSGYPVLSEIRMQRWGKRYRRDQNFLSAYKHWKQESEISIQYFEFHFLISAIIFSSRNMNRKLGYTGTNGILVIDLNAL